MFGPPEPSSHSSDYAQVRHRFAFDISLGFIGFYLVLARPFAKVCVQQGHRQVGAEAPQNFVYSACPAFIYSYGLQGQLQTSHPAIRSYI